MGQNLKRGRPLVGAVVTLPDVGLAELTAQAVDFVWIDLEHGALDVGDVQPLAVAARAGGAAAYARLREARDGALGAVLDAGVDGVVVPRVESPADAEWVAGRLRHPPRGTRGVASRRATGYGTRASAGPEPACVVQIETERALQDCEAIASVEGVGALVVGCADLAAALETRPHGAARELRAAIAAVQRAAAAAGVESGIAGADDPELLAELAGGESGLLVLGADVRLYARALDASCVRLRARTAVREPVPEESRVGA